VSAAIPDAAVPRLAPGARLREDPARGTLLLAPERVIVLNPVAAEVLRRCDGIASFGSLVAALAKEFDAPPERIAADVAKLLADLREKGLVELAEPS
jgi:pyrroloquinoline quinone biosynthesis protein D